MLQNRRLLCIALASTVMLSACGFKLRGSILGANLPFKTIYLGVPDSSPLGAELRRYIRSSGELQIVSDKEDAEAVLDILSETRDKQILSLNSQGRVREYLLNYRVTIRVRDNKNVELLPATQIALKRDISYNEQFVLAKESEEALLYRDMQSDLVQQILRRLAAIKPVTAGDTAAPAADAATAPSDTPANGK